MKYENIGRVSVIVKEIEDVSSILKRMELASEVSIHGPHCWIMSIDFGKYPDGQPPELTKSFIESLKNYYSAEIDRLKEELKTL